MKVPYCLDFFCWGGAPFIKKAATLPVSHAAITAPCRLVSSGSLQGHCSAGTSSNSAWGAGDGEVWPCARLQKAKHAGSSLRPFSSPRLDTAFLSKAHVCEEHALVVLLMLHN